MSEMTEEQIKQLEKEGFYDHDDKKIVPLSKTLKSGHGDIDQLVLSEPNGFNFEKLGHPFKMLSSDGKSDDDVDGDKSVEIELNIKKLNRYVELENTPQLGFGEARALGMKDGENARNAMLDFFGK